MTPRNQRSVWTVLSSAAVMLACGSSPAAAQDAAAPQADPSAASQNASPAASQNASPARQDASPAPQDAASVAARDATSAGAQQHPDFTGVWTNYTGAAQGRASGFGGPRAGLPLTEEGQRRVEEYRQLVGPERLNAAAHCADYGVPTMMSLPGSYPIEFIQKPDQLTIIFEVGNETRRIYIGDRQLPFDQRIPSRAGYSEGHWEGDALVVKTTDLLDGMDQSAHPFSDQAAIEERFSLEEDDNGTNVLTYAATITDPVYYTEPVRIERKYEPYDGFILPYSCQDELWYELLDLRRTQMEAGEPIDARMSDVYKVREDKE